MSDYGITRVRPGDNALLTQVEELLRQEELLLDGNLDAVCVMLDENGEAIATGSCFAATLRCFAVRKDHQGEGLLDELLTYLVRLQVERGNLHLFLCTKGSSAPFFRSSGFYEIARVGEKLVFMENRKNGFVRYLRALRRGTVPAERTAAIVMNANPFTLGHRFLVERAAMENDEVHLFLVSEDRSLIPGEVRRRLVREGTADLPNVILHDSGPYLLSSATFPSYFLTDALTVSECHARLDTAVFCRIAEVLGIGRRYVGEEPTSQVTGLYNRVLLETLPNAGIDCVVVPRKQQNGAPISASAVRQCLQREDWTALEGLVPPTTLAYFRSAEAEPVLEKLRSAGDVVHH